MAVWRTDGYADLIGYLETDPTAKDSSSPDVVTALPRRSGEEHPAVQDLGETSAAAAARAEQPAGSSPPASGSNSLRQLQQGTGSVDIVLELYDVPRKSRKTYKELLAAAAASPELLHKAIEKAAAATAAGFGSDGPAMVDITFRAVEHLPRASKENKQLQLTPGWSQMVFQPEAPQQPGGGPLYVQHSSDSGTAKAPGRPGSSVLVARALGDRPQPHSRAGSRHSSPPISRANSFTYVPVLIEPVRISGPSSIATADSSATGRGSSSGEPLQVIVDAAPPGAFIPPAAAADKDSAPGSAASLGLPAQRFTRSPSPRGASPLSGQTGSDGGAAAKARERAVPRERTTGP